MAEKADWTRLYFNILTDDKIMELMERHGSSGLGVYIGTIAMLGSATNRQIAIGRLGSVARMCHLSADEYRPIVDSMIEIGLLQKGNNAIRCDTLNKFLERLDGKRRRASEAGRRGAEARWGSKNDDSGDSEEWQPHSDPNATAMRSQCDPICDPNGIIEQSRGEESRGEQTGRTSTVSIPQSAEEVAQYFDLIGHPGGLKEAERFIDNYQSKGWMLGETLIRDWKARARVWKRDAHKHRSSDITEDFSVNRSTGQWK